MEHIASGLEGVVVAATRLSEVDGERGRLIIGGYPVEELAPHAHFEEVLFLLWHGRLPSPSERTALAEALAARRALPEATQALLDDAARRAVPAMDALRMGVASLSLQAHAGSDREAALDDAITLVAAIPTVIATYWRLREGRRLPALRRDLGHVAHFLWLLDGREADPAVVRALETYCNTVVDHGMNASTFTARVIASTQSDLCSAVVGAIGALKGPLHGGAPGPALDMVFALREGAARSGRSLDAETEDARAARGAGRRAHDGLRPSRLSGARPARRRARRGGGGARRPRRRRDVDRRRAHGRGGDPARAARVEAAAAARHQRRVLHRAAAARRRAAGRAVHADLRPRARPAAGRRTCWSRWRRIGSSARPPATSAAATAGGRGRRSDVADRGLPCPSPPQGGGAEAARSGGRRPDGPKPALRSSRAIGTATRRRARRARRSRRRRASASRSCAAAAASSTHSRSSGPPLMRSMASRSCSYS